MAEWLPIETAPTDRTWIMVCGGVIDYGWDGDNTPQCVAAQGFTYLDGDQIKTCWHFAWYDGGYYGEYENPTHWMPLPDPPKKSPD